MCARTIAVYEELLFPEAAEAAEGAAAPPVPLAARA
jgi:hypothetical protein